MKRSGWPAQRGPYRAGPWPGLTPSGATVLLACAAFLAVGQLMVGPPRRPLPDLPLVAATALLPMAIGLRIVGLPGAASAVCGAYLLPAALASLLLPSLPPPLLLLVPALAFDLVIWLPSADLASGAEGWPWRRRQPWRTRATTARGTRVSAGRAAVAGAMFGLALALVEPPFRVLLGANAAVWSGPPVWAAGAIGALSCAALATVLSARGTAS